MQNTFSDCAGERVEAVGSRVSEVSLFTMLVAEGVLGERSTGVRVHLLWNGTATVLAGGVQGETHTAGLHLFLHGEGTCASYVKVFLDGWEVLADVQ